MSDVVLVYPPYRNTPPGRSYSPLGLPYVASVLENCGYSVRIVDADMERLDVGSVASVVAAERPRLVGITVLTHALPGVLSLVESLRRLGITNVVVGGPHITADPQMVADLGLRYGIRGEAEYGFVKLAKYVLDGIGSEDDVEGLIVNDGGRLRAGRPCFLEDIDALPLPARHLVRTRDYRFTVVFSSRGCPYQCLYCAEQCRNVRFRSPDSVVDEIAGLVRDYGIRDVDFGDSVFTLDNEHVLEICRLLRERSVRVRWNCITRADLVDRKLLGVMKDSGCRFVSFGVESGVEDIRFAGGKRITDDAIREAFASCRQLGLRTRASILFGTPGETVADMRKSIDFVRSIRPDYALFSITQVFPGTPLFGRLLREGKAGNDVWRNFMHNKTLSLDYLPDGVTLEEAYEVSREAFRRFYLDNGYLWGKVRGVGDVYELSEAMFLVLAKLGVASLREPADEVCTNA
ncbi:MAG: radical SAM protein [Candidatus Altiarchaeota archaeon]|nr:radical SAM protein [Candidatus Altiarchaeota archaeon]